MAGAKKTNEQKVDKQLILDALIKYELTHGELPPSVFVFCEHLKISEESFYQHFASLRGVQKKIWGSFIEETLEVLHDDEDYKEYEAKEKLLAFYYTLLEVLKKKRSYVILKLEKRQIPPVIPSFLINFRKSYIEYIKTIIADKPDQSNMVMKMGVNRAYEEGFWIQLLFVLNFWQYDESDNFQNTDAAIEKAVNLSFDLIDNSVILGAIDFGKFLLQNRPISSFL